MNSKHAQVRAQQRGIPPLVVDLLDRYGCEQYDHRGAVTLHFTKASVRNMEKDMGRRLVAKLAEWFRAYKVVSTSDGQILTVGMRYRRLNRQ